MTTRFFRHGKRPAWGVGRLVEEVGDKLRLRFEDGKERVLLASIAHLVEVQGDEAPSDVLEATPAEKESALRNVASALLIKSVRLAVRDALEALKSNGAYPDDTLVDMQKGLSRITADYARFARTQAVAVRKAKAKEARALHKDHALEALFEELAERLESEPGMRTRAYESDSEAKEDLRILQRFVCRAPELDDDEIAQLEALLTPDDRAPW
ncbi:MAG: hypothetical protein AAGE52_14245 [Myxococcota bacterium]